MATPSGAADNGEMETIGRDAELGRIAAFLRGEGVAALVVVGPPGIGKTTVWEAALEEAASGATVLATRPAESVLPLSFAALADLLAEIDLGDFASLPDPQRGALEVLLHRARTCTESADVAGPAALGLVHVLRSRSAERPLLIAVDDVAWLDRPSLDMLAFAARRLRGAPVRFLFTRRTGELSELERALPHVSVEQLELGPLALGALRLLLAERLALNLSRRLLRRIHDASGGNPLLALELAASPSSREEPEPLTAPLQVRADDLFGARIGGLAPATRRALLAVALSPDLTEPELTELAGPETVQHAYLTGVITAEGRHLRVAHPLLAAAARSRSSIAERRALHLELARIASDPNRKLQHAAIAAPLPNAALAGRLSEAAAVSFARGRLHEAIELGQHALRLSPTGDDDVPERLLTLAEYLAAAGELPGVAALLGPRLQELPAGRARARAHLLLGEAATIDAHEQHLELALTHGAGDDELLAVALSARAVLLALIRVRDIEQADVLAAEAVVAARSSGNAAAEGQALHAAAWTRALRGGTIAETVADAAAATNLYLRAVERPAAVRLTWRGELREGRALLQGMLEVAEERGEARACVVLHLHRCELELRAGDAQAAADALAEWDGWTADEATADVTTIRARCRALLAAISGQPEEAARWADAVDAAAGTSGFVWDRLEALRARALAALQEGDAEAARSCLAHVWTHTRDAGIRDPGAFPIAGDLAEALLATGQQSEAAAVIDSLHTYAEEQQHPWATATAARSTALLEHDATGLEAAAAEYAALGLEFDAARTLLAAGRAARSRRQWGTARRLLDRAVSTFEELGASGWAATARASGGGPRPSPNGQLTSAEQRVAELAASGLSNKEIAARLTITVSTVETHLKRIYRKLAVGSRTQLAQTMKITGIRY